MVSLSSQVVVITGGARGIGAAVARLLHKRGARLVLVDVDAQPLAALAAELADDAKVMTMTADVRDLSAMQDVADKAVERFGGIDVVVANAGVASYGSLLQVDPEAFKRVMDVNVLGVFNTVRAALPSVIDRQGYVLIVSSMAAFAAAPGMAPYSTSKAGAEHLANALRLEVAYRGVKVGSAHMSWIDTDLIRDTKADLPVFGEMLAMAPWWPVNWTTSADKCARAFVKGIEGRKTRVYCPGWVGLFRWLKPVLTSYVGETAMRQSAPALLPRMDAEVAALGRSVSARTEASDAR
jgi:NAD(P)-dependent dehydrogenase (short-subunit alcohol dehydrogenase family)